MMVKPLLHTSDYLAQTQEKVPTIPINGNLLLLFCSI